MSSTIFCLFNFSFFSLASFTCYASSTAFDSCLLLLFFSFNFSPSCSYFLLFVPFFLLVLLLYICPLVFLSSFSCSSFFPSSRSPLSISLFFYCTVLSLCLLHPLPLFYLLFALACCQLSDVDHSTLLSKHDTHLHCLCVLPHVCLFLVFITYFQNTCIYW